MSAKILAATCCWPLWGFTANSPGAKCLGLLPRAMLAMAVMRVARRSRYSARSQARQVSAVMTEVPFMSARPSLGMSVSGTMPWALSASAAGHSRPWWITWRSPMRAAAT